MGRQDRSLFGVRALSAIPLWCQRMSLSGNIMVLGELGILKRSEEWIQLATICPSPDKPERKFRSRAPVAAAFALFVCLVGAFSVGGFRSRHEGGSATHNGRPIDFNQDVQPILASNCFSCHGPDP